MRKCDWEFCLQNRDGILVYESWCYGLCWSGALAPGCHQPQCWPTPDYASRHTCAELILGLQPRISSDMLMCLSNVSPITKQALRIHRQFHCSQKKIYSNYFFNIDDELLCFQVSVHPWLPPTNVSVVIHSWLILGLHPANERRGYFVTTCLIGRAQA